MENAVQPDTPLVSVIMATYNSADIVERAITSIMQQTFTAWELIIIDDGSTDVTVSLLESYASRDTRITILRNSENCGLAHALNRGMAIACGEYLARMDADDYSHPQRLQLQVEYLNKHQQVDVLGTGVRLLNPRSNERQQLIMPRYHQQCLQYLPKSTPFVHPTVMMRRSFWQSVGGYRENLRKAQDYELWVRGSKNHIYENLPEVLLDYTLPLNKSFKTVLKELKVRTICAYHNQFLVRSLFYSSTLLLSFIRYRVLYSKPFDLQRGASE